MRTKTIGSMVSAGLKLGKIFNGNSYLPSLVGPGFSKITTRSLHTAEKTICIGGASMVSSLLNKFRKNPHLVERTIFIGSDPWISKTHADWDTQSWGQSSLYLTKSQKEICDALFPHYPHNQLMMFGMVKEILAAERKLLLETGVEYIGEHIDSIEQKEGVGLVAHINGRERLITETTDFNIIHAARIHIEPEGLSAHNFGQMYWQSKKREDTHVAIVGSGVSLDWGCRDLNKVRHIVHLIPEGERARPDLKNHLDAAFRLEDSNLTMNLDETIDVDGINILNGRPMTVRLEASQVYSAMGYKLNEGLVNADRNRVTIIDGSPRPESIKVATALSSRQTSRVAHDLRGTAVPDGNMALNYLKIQVALGHYLPSESNSILLFDAWKFAVSQTAMAAGVEINDAFFESAEERVKSIYTVSVPPEAQLYKVLQSAYEKEGGTVDRNGDKLPWESFKELIHGSTDDVLKEAHVVEEDDDNALSNGPH